jgi:phage terminase small subunit
VIPFPKDARLLSERARRLYAGIKVTKDGIEVKMRDQDAALLNLAKHLGMFVQKVEHSGKNGGAIPIRIVGIEIVDPSEPKGP